MDIVRDYFFSQSTRAKDRQEAFLAQYQAQHGAGHDMFKVCLHFPFHSLVGPHSHTFPSLQINLLLSWFRRKAPSPAMFEAVKVPVMLLSGTSDTTVAPADALQQWYDLLVNGSSGRLSLSFKVEH